MAIQPTQLNITPEGRLRITWSDGQLRDYPFRELRDACPCASCREKRKEAAKPAELLPVLSPEEVQPLAIQGMEPVGNYAYSIQFSDGHDTGIFEFELLRKLGEVVTP